MRVFQTSLHRKKHFNSLNHVRYTLGRAYHDFGYNEHLSVTGIFFFLEKNTSDINVYKVSDTTSTIYNERIFMKLLVVS